MTEWLKFCPDQDGARANRINAKDFNCWSVKTPSGANVQITAKAKESLVLGFVNLTNINEKVAFEILDQFFQLHQDQICLFDMFEKKIKVIEEQLEACRTNQDQYVRVSRNYEYTLKEINELARKVVNFAIDYYFQERSIQIDCFQLILNKAVECKHAKDPNNASEQKELQCLKIFQDFFNRKIAGNLGKQCIQRLIKNLSWDKREFVETCNQGYSKQDLCKNLQNEQMMLLKLLFSFYLEFPLSDVNEIGRFIIDYLSVTNFQQTKAHFQSGQAQYSEEYRQKKKQIEDLGLVISLSQIQAQPIDRQKELVEYFLNKKVSNHTVFEQMMKFGELNSSNAPIYLYITELITSQAQLLNEDKKDQISQMQDKISHNALVQLDQLLQHSEFFTLNKFKNLQAGVYMVIKKWLNEIHQFLTTKDHNFVHRSFLGDQNIAYEQTQLEKAYTMGMQLLKNEQIVKSVWQDWENENFQSIDSPAIFNKVLSEPWTYREQFLTLAEILCGNNRIPFGYKMFKVLNERTNQERPHLQGKTLLYEMLYHANQLLLKLMNQQISSNGELDELNSCLLIFTKIIKQDPEVLYAIDQCYKTVVDRLDGGMVYFFLHALHHILSESIPDLRYVKEVAVKILKTLAKLFDVSVDIQVEIIKFMHESRDIQPEGMCNLVTIFEHRILDSENEIQDFSITEALLHLLCKIFKMNGQLNFMEQARLYTDQEVMLNEQQAEIEVNKINNSFPIQALENIYVPLMNNYFELKFSNVKSLGALTSRLIKLTRLLLLKFVDIPSKFKAPLQEPCSQFDIYLDLLKQILNAVPLLKICQKNLTLTQVEKKDAKNKTSMQVENKFLASALETNAPASLKRLKKMILNALECMNLCLQLVSNIGEGSKRSLYTSKLDCVQKIKMCVSDFNSSQNVPVESLDGGQQTQSVLSQICYYITPSEHLANYKIQEQAINCLTNCIGVWSLKSEKQPELLHLLQDNFTQIFQIREKFVKKLLIKLVKEYNMVTNLQVLEAILEFFCMAAKYQPRFIEMCFQPSVGQEESYLDDLGSEVELLFKDRDENFQSHQAANLNTSVKLKLVVFFSLLSTESLQSSMSKDRHVKLLKTIYDYFITTNEFNKIMTNDLRINGEYLKPYCEEEKLLKIEENTIQIIRSTDQTRARVVYYYFMQLAGSVYSRYPEHNELSSLVVFVFKNMVQQKTLLYKQQMNDFESLLPQLKVANTYLSTMEIQQDWDLDLQERVLDYYQSSLGQMRQGITTLTIKNIESNNLFSSLSLKPLFSLMFNCNRPALPISNSKRPSDQHADILQQAQIPGNIGAEFFVSISQELTYCLESQVTRCANKDFVTQIQSVFQQFNLILGNLHVSMHLMEAKKDFIQQIGKTTFELLQKRDISDKNASVNDLLRASLFPLVLPVSQIKTKYDAVMNQKSEELITFLLTLAEQSLNQELGHLKSLQSSDKNQIQLQQNEYQYHQGETGCQNLIFILGALNSQISGRQKIPQNLCSSIERIVDQILINLHEMFSNEDEVQFSLMVSIGLACLQLSKLLCPHTSQKDIQQLKTRGNKLQIPLFSLLSKVFDGIQADKGLDKSIQIIKILLNDPSRLLERSQLQVFLRKQDCQPLKVLLHRFSNDKTSPSNVHQIIEFFIEYSQFDGGAETLSEISILTYLTSHWCIKSIEPFYKNEKQSPQRNPCHMIWCHILLLIRTLNTKMKGKDFKLMVYLVKSLNHRFASILSKFDQIQEDKSPYLVGQSAVSIAVLEELQLLTCLLQQLSMSAEDWACIEPKNYMEMKEILVIAMPQLLHRFESASVLPASYIEHHLKEIVDRNYSSSEQEIRITALGLKAEISVFNIYFNWVFSLREIFVTNSKRIELVNDWSKSFISNHPNETPLKLAYNWFQKVQTKMNQSLQNYSNLKRYGKEQQKIAHYMENLFKNETQVQEEYPCGLNLSIMEPFLTFSRHSSPIGNLVEQLETTVVASEQVNCLMLVKIRELIGDQQCKDLDLYQIQRVCSAQEQSLRENSGNRSLLHEHQNKLFLNELSIFIGKVKDD